MGGGSGGGAGGEFLRDLVLRREAPFETKALKESGSPIKDTASSCPSVPSARGGAPGTGGRDLSESVLT